MQRKRPYLPALCKSQQIFSEEIWDMVAIPDMYREE